MEKWVWPSELVMDLTTVLRLPSEHVMPTVDDRLSCGRENSDRASGDRQIAIPENLQLINESFQTADQLSRDRNRHNSRSDSRNQLPGKVQPSDQNNSELKSSERSTVKHERSRLRHSPENEKDLLHRGSDQRNYGDTSNDRCPQCPVDCTMSCSDRLCTDRHRSYSDHSRHSSTPSSHTSQRLRNVSSREGELYDGFNCSDEQSSAFRDNKLLDSDIDDRLERSGFQKNNRHKSEPMASTKSRSDRDNNEDSDRRIQQRLLELSGCHDLSLETQNCSWNSDRHYIQKDKFSSNRLSPCSYASVTDNATVWTIDDQRKREADKRQDGRRSKELEDRNLLSSLELEMPRKAKDKSRDKSLETSRRRESRDKSRDKSRRRSKDSHDLEEAVELASGKNSNSLKKKCATKRHRENSRDKLSGKTKKRTSRRHSHSSSSKKKSGKSSSERKTSSKHKKTKRRHRHYSSDSLPDLDAIKPPGDADEKSTGLVKTDAVEVPVSETASLTTPVADSTKAKITTGSSIVVGKSGSSADGENLKRYFTPRKRPDKLTKDDNDDDDFIPMKVRKDTHDDSVLKMTHNVSKSRDTDVAARHLLRSIIHRKSVKRRFDHATAAASTISCSESAVDPVTAVKSSLPSNDASISEIVEGVNGQTDVVVCPVSEECVKNASNSASTDPSRLHGSSGEALDTKLDPLVSPYTENLHKITDVSPPSSVEQNDVAVMAIMPTDGNPVQTLEPSTVTELPAAAKSQEHKDQISTESKLSNAVTELGSQSNLPSDDDIHGLMESSEKEISVNAEHLPDIPCSNSKQSDAASESDNNSQSGTEKKETELTGPPAMVAPVMGPPLMGPPLIGTPLMGPPLMGPPLMMPVIFKKPLMARRLGLRISDQSAAIISAGVRQEKEVVKEKNREEGEITDSSEEESESDVSDDDDDDNVDDEPANNDNDAEHQLTATALQSLNSYADLDSSGSITDSEEEGELPPDETAEDDVEKHAGVIAEGEAVAGTDSVKKREHKKSKKKHGESKSKKKTKKHKKRSKSKEKSGKSSRSKHQSKTKKGSSVSDKLRRRALSRSRSRSYSVMRTFDEARGVWRMKRPEKIQAKLEAQRRLKACSNLRIQIDKERLREIAVMNAYKNMKLGRGPKVSLKATEIARLMAGGKTIEELTDFCKSMARSGRRSSGSECESDEERNWHRAPPSDDESDEAMLLRNRKLLLNKETKMIMNIRNSRQIPVLSKEEKTVQAAILRQNFPVSSGVQHRDRESEWQPYVKPMAAPAPVAAPASTEEKLKPEATLGVNVKSVGEIVTERLNALRQLSANPNDTAAMSAAMKLQQQLQQWAASKQNPGALPVGTRVRMPRSLFKSTPGHLLTTTTQNTTEASSAVAVSTNVVPPKGGAVLTDSCIGKLLLQKMGWKDGEGLGKDNSGPTAPLILDMKKDRKGLAWDDPSSRLPKHSIYRPQPLILPPGMQDLSRLHPISALNEMCLRKRWRNPVYELIDNCGPDHCKSFRFKVTVDGVEYLPAVGSGNKKTARMEAALACLHEHAAMMRLSDAVNFPNVNVPSQPRPLLGLQVSRPAAPRLLPPRPLKLLLRPMPPLQPRAFPPQRVFCPPQNISDQAPFTFDILDSEANNLCGPPLKLSAENPPAEEETSDNVEKPTQPDDRDKEIVQDEEEVVSDERCDSLLGDPNPASKPSLLGACPAPGLLGAPPAAGLLGPPPVNQRFSVPSVRITSLMNLRCAPANRVLTPRGLLPTPTRQIVQPRAPVAGRINAAAVPRPRLNFVPRLPQFLHRNVRPLLSDFGHQPQPEFAANFVEQYRGNFAQHSGGGGELFRDVSFTDDVFENEPAFSAAAFDEDLRFNQRFPGFPQIPQEFAGPSFPFARTSQNFSENPAEHFNLPEEELFQDEQFVESSGFGGSVFEQFTAGFAPQVPSIFEQQIRPRARALFFPCRPGFSRPPSRGMMSVFPEEHEWPNR